MHSHGRPDPRADLSRWAHTAAEVPRLTDPTLDRFHAAAGRPVVIRHAPASDGAPPPPDLAFVRDVAGRVEVPVYVSADGTFPGGEGPYDPSKYCECRFTINELLDRWSGALRSPILTEGERYYVYQVPAEELAEIADRFVPPDYVPRHGFGLSRNVWLSSAGNITPIHYDVAENLLVQVFGVKRVLVWSPDEYPRLYLNPLGVPHDRQTRLDVYDHRPDEFPLFESASAWACTLEAGDMLYVPAFWPHYVRTEQASLSVNHWWPLEGTLALLAALDSPVPSEAAFRQAVAAAFASRPELVGFWDHVVQDSGLDAVLRFTGQYVS